MTKRKPKPGAIATLNMPQKGHTTQVSQRRLLVRVNDIVEKENSISLPEFIRKTSNIFLPRGWTKEISFDTLLFKKQFQFSSFSEFQIMVHTGLCFTIKIFDWFPAEDHQIYKQSKRNINNTNIQDIMTTLDKSNVCEGVAYLGKVMRITYYMYFYKMER